MSLLDLFKVLLITDHLQKRGETDERSQRQRLAAALKAEIENEFPERSAGLSEGVTSLIAIEILKPDGTYQKILNINKKLLKTNDWEILQGKLRDGTFVGSSSFQDELMRLDGVSKNTKYLFNELTEAKLRYIDFFVSQLSSPLRDYLEREPVIRFLKVHDITNRAVARAS
jgi:hypothetical protein